MPNTNHIRRFLGTLSVLALLAGGFIGQAPRLYASSWDPTVLVNTESFQVIDDLDGTSDVYIQFGDSLNKRLKYDRTKAAFVFDDDVEIIGTLSGVHLHAQDLLTSSGNLVVEGSNLYIGTSYDVSDKVISFGTSAGGGFEEIISVNALTNQFTISDTTQISGEIRATGSGNIATDFWINTADEADADATITFGNASGNQTFTFNHTTQWFEVSKDLEVQGTASGRHLHAQDLLTSSGGLVVEGNTVIDTNTLVVDSATNRVGIGESSPTNTLHINTGNADGSSEGMKLALDNGTLVGQFIEFEGNPTFEGAAGSVFRVGVKDTGSAEIQIDDSGANPYTQFDVAGANVMRLDHNGNVGIGLTTPEAKLDVLGTVSGSTIRSFGLSDCDNATSSKLLWDATTGQFSCGTDQTGGSSGFTGTGSLQAFFDNRYVEVGGDTMTGALIINDESPDAKGMLQVQGVMSGAHLRVSSGAVFQSGRVGITTNAPIASLHVLAPSAAVDTDAEDVLLVRGSAGYGASGFGYRGSDIILESGSGGSSLNDAGDGGDVRIEAGAGGTSTAGIGGEAGDIYLTTRSGTSYGNILMAKDGGNVAIGTVTPEATLDVVGSVSGATLRSFGLTDCDNSTWSKLLWDTTTGKFSCGTDQGATSISQWDADIRYVAVQGDTMTGGLLIDVGDGNESNTIDNGLALEVTGTASGEHLHFGRLLTGSGTVRIQNVSDSTTSFQVLDADGGTSVFNIDTTNERVGIGNNSPSYPLDVTGDLRATGNMYVGNFMYHDGDLDTYFQFDDDIIYLTSGAETFFAAIEDGFQDELRGNAVNSDVDFAWYGNTNDRIFTIDAANETVGIGLNSLIVDPDAKLEVVGTMSGTALTVSSLKNCDTIDTDANGVLSCGTDNGGGAGFTGTGSLQAFFDNRYVETAGDTMTGALTIQPTDEDAGTLKLVGSGSHALVSASGGSIIHTARGTNQVVGSILDATNLNGAFSVEVRGRYAYVANFNDDSLRIIDIHEPSSPTIVGGVQDNTDLDGAVAVALDGNYAYVVTFTDDSLRVIDISNPTSPRIVGGVKDAVQLNGARSIAVAGKYAYVVNEFDDSLRIIDISDPTNPWIVGGLKDTANMEEPYNVVVADRYAYVASYASDALRIIDISDPTNPSIVGGVQDATDLNGADAVAVSSRYAYVGTYIDDSVRIIDISDPTNPSIVGGVKDATLLNRVFNLDVAGRYVYAASTENNSVQVIDVSDPANPFVASGIYDTTNLANVLDVQVVGRYAYAVGSSATDTFSVIDLNGLETPTAFIGAIEAGKLHVQTQGIFGGNVQIEGSLNVGVGGIKTEGQSAITVASGVGLRVESTQPGTGATLEFTGMASGSRVHAEDLLTSSGTIVAETAFFGAGLSDCDTAATSKLLWDATTGTFSCGTDQTGGSSGFTGTGSLQSFFDNRYVAVQGDTMTGGLLIDVGAGNESNTIDSGLALEVVGTASGEHLHFGRMLTGSGTVRIQNVTDSTTSFQVLDADGGNPVFNIDTTNERVGIGTNTPDSILDIISAGQTVVGVSTTTDVGDTNAVNINIVSDSDGVSPATSTIGHFGDSTLRFSSIGNIVTQTDLAITADHEIGIGTASPNTKLDVAGGISGVTLKITGATALDGEVTFGSGIIINGVTYRFPFGDGSSSGKVLKTDGNGNLSWSDDATGASSGFTGTGSLQAFFDNRYVETAGDTMTGALTIQPTDEDAGTLKLVGSGSHALVSASGGSIIHTARGNNESVGGVSSVNIGGDGKIAIVGDYAYVPSNTAHSLSIVDITDPTSPTILSTLIDTSSLNGASAVTVVGKYAYVTAYNDDSLQIVDISDPLNPFIVSEVQDSLNLNGAHDVVVSGRYAYVAATVDDSVQVIDISDPTNPYRVTEIDSSSLNAIRTIVVRGKYIYTASNVDDSMRIIDISNPENIFIAGGLQDATNLNGAYALDVQGRYAYVVSNVDNSMRVVDISDPSNVSIVGGVQDNTLLAGVRDISVHGRYAYVTPYSNNSMRIIDISDPSAPIIVGGIQDASSMQAPVSVKVSGRYAYVKAASSNAVRVIDLNGFETPVADIGAIKTALLHVQNNGIFDGNVTIQGGLQVGAGGLQVGGQSAIYSASGTALKVQSLDPAASPSMEVIGAISGTTIHAQDTLTSSGTLVWEGAASGSSLYVANGITGSGLSDCDNATTSKLLWDVTTGRFSCGTDQTGGSSGFTGTGSLQSFFDNRYVAVQGDTMTGGLLIDIGAGNESNTIDSGLALEVVGTASGEHLHFGRLFTGSGTVRIQNVSDSITSFQVLDADGGTSVFNIDTTNERVGIGTDAPRSSLHVFGTAPEAYIESDTSHASLFLDSGTSAQAGVYFREASANKWALGVDGVTDAFTISTSDVTATDGFTITSTNNVGIGTSTAGTKLEVVGTASGAALYGYDINNSKAAVTGSLLISRTANAPEWAQPTSAMMWYIDGDVATGTKQGATVVMPYGFTVTDVDMRVDTAPTGSSLIVDINEGGATIFSTRPEIDASATSEDGNHVISDTTLAAGSEITLDVDQVGSSVAGADLTVILKGRRHY